MVEKHIKNLKIKFAGDLDWKKLRDLLVLKMIECETEEKFSFLIEGLVGSMFNNIKEMDENRKKMRLKMLTEIEKREIRKAFKEKDGN